MSGVTDRSNVVVLLVRGFSSLALLALPWAALAAAEEGAEEEAPRKIEEGRIFTASELRRNPDSEGTPVDEWTAESPNPAAGLEPGPEIDSEACRLPALKLEALDASSRRAVVRDEEGAVRVVRPGSKIAGTAVVRFVAEDKLVAEGTAGADGKKPVFWIHLPEKPGELAGVQCFLPEAGGSAGSPASRSDESPIDEPEQPASDGR